MTAPPVEIDLRLRSVRTFFSVPDIDPFDGESIDESGVDQIMDMIKAQRGWRGRPVRATLHVPPSPEARDLAARMPAALASYCDRHIQHTDRKLREIRAEGWRALLIGVAFLALCLALAAGIEGLIGSERLFGRLLVEGAVIAGWVGLWRPIELLLFDWWPLLQDLRLYRKLRGMDVTVQFDGTAAAVEPHRV